MSFTSPIPHEASSQLMGIVAIFLTNGNKYLDAGNDTRYEFFPSGWMEAITATEWLVDNGYVEWEVDLDEDDYRDNYNIFPTAKGVAAAMGRW